MLKFKTSHWLNKPNENNKIDDFCEISQIKTVKNRFSAFWLLFESDEDCVIRLSGDLYFRQKLNVPSYRLDIGGGYKAGVYPAGFMTDDDGVAKADILLENDFVEINKGKIAAVWVELDIPDEASDGKVDIKLYRSFMFSAEEYIGGTSLDVAVIGYTLPDAKDFSFYLDLWQHSSNLARKHEVKRFGDRHFEILEEYVKTMAYLGQKAVTIVASEIPWAGQGCYTYERAENLYEYSMIKVTKKANGRFAYDFSAVKRYIEICRKHGIDKEISVYGLVNVWNGKDGYDFSDPSDYPDHIRVRYYDEASGTYRFMTKAKEIDGYIKAIQSFFVRTKLIDKVRIAADEPAKVEAFKKSLARIRKVAPRFKYKAALLHTDFLKEFDFISDFVPFIVTLSQGYEDVKRLAGSPDKRMLWYVCCGPVYPNTFIRSGLHETLFITALTSYLNLEGFLRWNYTVFPDFPRQNITIGPFPAGEGNFVYPANDGRPLLTVRYKALRYGIELFEMLQAVKNKATKDEREELFSLIIKEKDVSKYYPPAGERLDKSKMMSEDIVDYQRFYEKLYEIITR